MTAFIIVFSLFILLIVVHEYGHYLMAKHCGITPTEFSVGFGPKICGKKKGGTEWNLRIIPAGGYCAMDDKDLNGLSPKQRIAVFAAGPLMNLFFALVSYYLLCIFRGNPNFFMAMGGAFRKMFEFLPNIWKSLTTAFDTGKNTMTMAESSVQIVNFVNNQPGILTKLASVMSILYTLNALLFLCNILPIPALDGGHILFTIPELFGKPLNSKIVNNLTAVCYYAMISLSVLYFAKDILLQVWRLMS